MLENIRELLQEDLTDLKRLVEDYKTHEHIIASILEIKEEGIPDYKVLKQLDEEIFPHMSPELYGTIYGLCKFVSGRDYAMIDYCNERANDESFDKQKWLDEVTGEVYQYIDTYG